MTDSPTPTTRDLAEMSALCAFIARHGLPSPYGGCGYVDGPNLRHAETFERLTRDLLESAR